MATPESVDLPAGFVADSGSDLPPGFRVENVPQEKTTSQNRQSPPGEKSEGMIPQWIKAAVLPTIGGVGGGFAGGALTTPSVFGVPAGVLGGEMAGAALGEQANQWLGITEPSKTNVALSGLSAPVGRAAGPLLKGGLSTLTKTFAGRDIMSEAAESLLKKWMAPTVASADLFKQADALKMIVPSAETVTALDNVITKELHRAPTAIRDEILKTLEPLKKYFSPSTGGVRGISAPEMMEESQRLRIIASQAYDDGNVPLARTVNAIRGAMLNDLEQNGGGVVKEAAKAYRKEMALEDLGKLLGKPHPLVKIKDFTKDNPLFKGAFTPQEMAQIERIAKKLASVPASGGSGIWGKTITGVTGAEMGGVPGAIMGFLGPDAIKAIMSTQFGRNYAERILGSSSTLNHDTMAALAIFARGMMGKKPDGEQVQNPESR